MSTNIEEALANCLERVESGEISPQEALGLYPELRVELEPLLALTAELSAMPKVEAPTSLRGYKRPVFRAAPARESWWRRLLPAGGPSLGWATPLAQAAAVIAVVVFAGGGTFVAAASSLPDEPLYPVKLALENAQLALAQDDHARAQLELQLASKRLAEVESAAQLGRPDAVAKGLELYQQNADAAAKASEATSSSSVDQQVQDSLRNNVDVLTQVRDKVGNPQAKAAIAAAIDRSLAASNGLSGKDKTGGQVGKSASEPTVTASPIPTSGASSSTTNPTATPAVAQPENPAGHEPPGKARGLSEATASPVPTSGASSSATNPTATPAAVVKPENPAGHEPPGKVKGLSDEPGNSGQGNPQSQEPRGQGQKQQVVATPESSPAPAAITHTPTPTLPGNKVEAPGANRGNGQDKSGNDPITNGPDRQLTSDTEKGNSKKDFVSTIVESIRGMFGRR